MEMIALVLGELDYVTRMSRFGVEFRVRFKESGKGLSEE